MKKASILNSPSAALVLTAVAVIAISIVDTEAANRVALFGLGLGCGTLICRGYYERSPEALTRGDGLRISEINRTALLITTAIYALAAFATELDLADVPLMADDPNGAQQLVPLIPAAAIGLLTSRIYHAFREHRAQ